MMRPFKILLCGERGVGKTTLLKKLLLHSPCAVNGFSTKRLPEADPQGFYPIYIHPAAQPQEERHYGKDNLVGRCDSRRSIRYPQVFDTLGVALLRPPTKGILLMDELGFLENEALLFQRAVLQALQGDVPVMAAVKPKDTEFLCKVRSQPGTQFYFIDRENREDLLEKLLPVVQAWQE